MIYLCTTFFSAVEQPEQHSATTNKEPLKQPAQVLNVKSQHMSCIWKQLQKALCSHDIAPVEKKIQARYVSRLYSIIEKMSKQNYRNIISSLTLPWTKQIRKGKQ